MLEGPNLHHRLAPREGLEPPTMRLTVADSAVELPRNTHISYDNLADV